jgi:hypothetical protein
VVDTDEIKDVMEHGQPHYSIDSFDKPVVTGKIYFMGLTEQVTENDGQIVRTAHVLSAPIDHIDTYIEYGSDYYNR